MLISWLKMQYHGTPFKSTVALTWICGLCSPNMLKEYDRGVNVWVFWTWFSCWGFQICWIYHRCHFGLLGPLITLENSDIPNLYYPGCCWDCRKKMLGLPTVASGYTRPGLFIFFGLQGIMWQDKHIGFYVWDSGLGTLHWVFWVEYSIWHSTV